jgi:hypothetical protein
MRIYINIDIHNTVCDCGLSLLAFPVTLALVARSILHMVEVLVTLRLLLLLLRLGIAFINVLLLETVGIPSSLLRLLLTLAFPLPTVLGTWISLAIISTSVVLLTEV